MRVQAIVTAPRCFRCDIAVHVGRDVATGVNVRLLNGTPFESAGRAESPVDRIWRMSMPPRAAFTAGLAAAISFCKDTGAPSIAGELSRKPGWVSRREQDIEVSHLCNTHRQVGCARRHRITCAYYLASDTCSPGLNSIEDIKAFALSSTCCSGIALPTAPPRACRRRQPSCLQTHRRCIRT